MASRKPKPTAEEFTKALLAKPKRYTICRDIRHAWQPIGGFHYHVQYVEGASAVFVARDFKCIRCESRKKEVFLERELDGKPYLERHGNLIYEYSDGYKLPPKPVGVKPQQVLRTAAWEDARKMLKPHLRVVE